MLFVIPQEQRIGRHSLVLPRADSELTADTVFGFHNQLAGHIQAGFGGWGDAGYAMALIKLAGLFVEHISHVIKGVLGIGHIVFLNASSAQEAFGIALTDHGFDQIPLEPVENGYREKVNSGKIEANFIAGEIGAAQSGKLTENGLPGFFSLLGRFFFVWDFDRCTGTVFIGSLKCNTCGSFIEPQAKKDFSFGGYRGQAGLKPVIVISVYAQASNDALDVLRVDFSRLALIESRSLQGLFGIKKADAVGIVQIGLGIHFEIRRCHIFHFSDVLAHRFGRVDRTHLLRRANEAKIGKAAVKRFGEVWCEMQLNGPRGGFSQLF